MNRTWPNLFALLWFWASAQAWAEPIRIAAASSLGPAISTITQDKDVQLNLGGSGRIARQVMEGAPADIVALANTAWMQTLSESGLLSASSPIDVLGNRLVIVVRPGLKVTSLSGLHALKRIGLGADGVPVGEYAGQALRQVGLWEDLESRLVFGASARAVLAHAAAGSVDAAIVYQTDALTEPQLETQFIVDRGLHSPIRYPFALTMRGAERPEAVALFKTLTGPGSTGTYLRYGFEPPEATRPTLRHGTVRVDFDPLPPLWRSMGIALAALGLCLLPALALGWLLARRRFRGKAIISTLCLSPLVLPPVVTGWLLLRLFSAAGLDIAFTRWAAVLAAAAVGFPLLLILIRGAIESVDVRFPQVAQTLGLSPLEAFRKVTLPLALPGIAAGCVLAFSRALGEFGATAMFAGDQPGETRTLALAVYALMEQPGGESGATTLVIISVAITLISLLAYERLVWHGQRRREDPS